MTTVLTMLEGLLIFLLGVPLLVIVVGLFMGTVMALYNLKEALAEAHQVRPVQGTASREDSPGVGIDDKK